jgi:hypothetical protein
MHGVSFWKQIWSATRRITNLWLQTKAVLKSLLVLSHREDRAGCLLRFGSVGLESFYIATQKKTARLGGL